MTTLNKDDVILEDIGFTSALEIDRKVSDNVDYFFQLRDHSTRHAFQTFNNHHQTLSALFSANIFISIFTIPYIIVMGTNLAFSSSAFELSSCIIILVLLLTINITVWKVYLHIQQVLKGQEVHLSASLRDFLHRFQMLIYFLLEAIVSYRHVVRTIIGECKTSFFTQAWNCNNLESKHMIVVETTMILMMIPLLYLITVKAAHVQFAIFLWLFSMAVIAFSLIYDEAFNSILFVFYYMISSIFIMLEARRQNYFLFFTHLKLQEILKEREKAADEANAEEMRHMIANVAHDLKTPLASFTAGVEFIGQIITDGYHKLTTEGTTSPSDVNDAMNCITTCITNMRNTNSFMLMTINRCIDYTKASKGVKLVPKFETIDLMDTLSLPLNCMKDIQQRVSIVLQPISKEICSHIITDKQWLQENVLCLLSNAVKYSNEGEVTISVVLVENERKFQARINSRSMSAELKLPNDQSPQQQRNSPCLDNTLSQASLEDEKDSRIYPSLHLQNIMNRNLYLRVEIEDHGIGLSEDVMSTLFSPFKQAQRLAGGTGLGLFSLAKRLEALEGGCGVQRRRDGEEGSLFWFEIPYRPDYQAVESPSSSPSNVGLLKDGAACGACAMVRRKDLFPDSKEEDNAGRPVPIRIASLSTFGILEPMKILLVDDSPAILKLISMMLRRHNHEVFTATNGAEALKLCENHMKNLYESCNGSNTSECSVSIRAELFDVILMDLQMPVMDGLEATKRIRLLEQGLHHQTTTRDDVTMRVHPHNLIIGVSANSDSETTDQAYKMGVDAFISKPFSLNTFYKTYQNIRQVQLSPPSSQPTAQEVVNDKNKKILP